ncbi:MAG: hypothetical protein ABIJ40_15715, partial [Bacteroidota bacterium]
PHSHSRTHNSSPTGTKSLVASQVGPSSTTNRAIASVILALRKASSLGVSAWRIIGVHYINSNRSSILFLFSKEKKRWNGLLEYRLTIILCQSMRASIIANLPATAYEVGSTSH